MIMQGWNSALHCSHEYMVYMCVCGKPQLYLITAVGTHDPHLQTEIFEGDENLSYLHLILMHCIELQIYRIRIIISKPSK